MSENHNFALMPRTPGALEKAEPGAKRILAAMVAETLALVPSEDAGAQYQKGCAYRDGDGVRQDYTEAVRWFRKAAEQGHANAQHSLGFLYARVPSAPDYAQAAHWYRKAAEQGFAEAQCDLGWCYEFGQGVPQDYAQAVHWYRKAAEQGWGFFTPNAEKPAPHRRTVEEKLTALSALMSPAERAESEPLYEEHSKRKQA